jgi:hypothetical protein
MKEKTKQELQDMIAAHDVAIYALLRTTKKPSLQVACSKLATFLSRDKKKLIMRFENYSFKKEEGICGLNECTLDGCMDALCIKRLTKEGG